MHLKLWKLLRILPHPKVYRALLEGVAAGIEHKGVLENIERCFHVVDIGANRGQFALITRLCYPEAKINSFEPLQEPAKIFKKIFFSDKLTKLHPFAVGPSTGEALIHVSSSDDSSSLLPISKEQTSIFPNTGEKEIRVVQVKQLSECLSENEIASPALLKIDVQGYELSALRGCSTLFHRFKYVYVESSFVELYVGQSLASEVIEYLSNYKYQLIGVYNMYYDQHGRSIQADFLFERSE